MDAEPTDQELYDFITAVLADVHKSLREPEVINEAIHDHRGTWVMLYRVDRGTDVPDARS